MKINKLARKVNHSKYRDLDFRMAHNPVSKDVVKVNDDNAIKQSIKTLLMSRINHDFKFHPEIGSQLYSLLFEPFNVVTKASIIRVVTNTLNNFEPRITVNAVDVNENRDNNALIVTIMYTINNINVDSVYNLTLYRTR